MCICYFRVNLFGFLVFIAAHAFMKLWVVTSVYFIMMGYGMLVGISNCMLPVLLAPDSPIKMDLDKASWLNASISIGAMLTYFIASILMACYGRRFASIIGLVPCIASPLTCYLATDFYVLVLGRFLGGVGLGALGIVGAVVIGEYTTPEYRGVFLNMKSCILVVGSTLTHVLGNYLHWRTVMLIMTLPYSCTFVMAFFWPESPSWLASQKRFDESTESFYWLRGKSEKSTRELNAMIEAQKNVEYDRDMTLRKRVRSILIKLKKRNFWKPVGVYTFAAMLLETSGRHMFPAYAMQFMQQMDSDKSNTFLYTICLDLIMCFSSFASVILVKVMKRRTLVLGSGAASVAVLLLVSLYYYLQSKSLISNEWNPVSLVLFGAYFVLVNVGSTPISLTLTGELFPLEHRSIGSAMAGILISIFMFITLKITPLMLSSIKVYGTFTVYSASMAFCLVVLYLTLPETKDKTLQEIEDNFNSNKTIDVNSAGIRISKHEDLEVNSKLLT